MQVFELYSCILGWPAQWSHLLFHYQQNFLETESKLKLLLKQELLLCHF